MEITTKNGSVITLTKMQAFFLNAINESDRSLNASYLAVKYYDSIGVRRPAASRDSFGQTSAAYRTCRFLTKHGLVKEYHEKGASGFSYTLYGPINPQLLSSTENPLDEEEDDDDDDEYDFQPCDNCDLPDACADHGCAIKAGIRVRDNSF